MRIIWLVAVAVCLGSSDAAARAPTAEFELYSRGPVVTYHDVNAMFARDKRDRLVHTALKITSSPYSESAVGSPVGTPTDTAGRERMQNLVNEFYNGSSGPTIAPYDLENGMLPLEVTKANLGSSTAWSIGAAATSSVAPMTESATLALDQVAQASKSSAMPESESLLLLGTGLLSASGLCIYRASRLKRSGFAMV